MEAHTNRIAALIIKYCNSTLSDKEQEELNFWRNLSAANENLFKLLTDDSYLSELNNIDVQAEQKKIRQLYKTDTGRPLPIRRSKAISIAASIIILLIAGTIWISLPSSDNKPVLSKSEPQELRDSKLAVNNVLHLAKEVTLTLSNDSTIHLDDMTPGTHIDYKNSRLVKLTNELLRIVPVTFDAPNSQLNEVIDAVFNTIRVPRGRQFELELADGSTVWLNAASTFSFPTTFNANQRYVELIGEAYFKVSSIQLAGTKIPFKVNAHGMQISVLSTQFTVNAYDDEPEIKTTLIEGEIDILQEGIATTVKTGQQAILRNGKLTLNFVNLEADTAWINNEFNFDNTPLRSIMGQIGRWYDVEFSFDCCELTTYTITIPRNKTLSEFLKIMEETEDVRFKITGRKILVTSK